MRCMDDDLIRPVTRALAAHRRAQSRVEETRFHLHHAIAEAVRRGVKQADLARLTGYTRERLRQIVNAHKSEGDDA